MCIFSGPVDAVSDTIILGGSVGDRQLLAYQMTVATRERVAMVLPIPTPVDAPEDAVRFHDVGEDPLLLFDLVGLAFPKPRPRPTLDDGPIALSLGQLPVVELSTALASFVPHARHFHRLDPAFRLGPSVLAELPELADFGWVVVQLKPGHSTSPIGFDFPRRDRTRLWFPTRHVHDGTVPDAAHYDHRLVTLGLRNPTPDHRDLAIRWRAAEPADERAALARAVDSPLAGLLAEGWWCGRVFGSRWNRDQWLHDG